MSVFYPYLSLPYVKYVATIKKSVKHFHEQLNTFINLSDTDNISAGKITKGLNESEGHKPVVAFIK